MHAKTLPANTKSNPVEIDMTTKKIINHEC